MAWVMQESPYNNLSALLMPSLGLTPNTSEKSNLKKEIRIKECSYLK